eukprot:1195305-Prorocentrum_minimum.AAC.7
MIQYAPCRGKRAHLGHGERLDHGVPGDGRQRVRGGHLLHVHARVLLVRRVQLQENKKRAPPLLSSMYTHAFSLCAAFSCKKTRKEPRPSSAKSLPGGRQEHNLLNVAVPDSGRHRSERLPKELY